MAGIGVDVGGTYIKFVAVDDSGFVLKRAQSRTPDNGAELIKVIAGQMLALKRGLKGHVRAGMGFAGAVDFKRGLVCFSPNIPSLKDLDVTAQVRKLTGLPCVIDNDANMAAWGAYDFELKKKYANVVAVTLGTGVGGGFILNGEMFRGSTGAAAEIGHMILRLGGAKCACGNRGCLEAYAGRYGLINHARTAYGKAGRELPPDATPQWLYEAAEKGDKVALELWEKMGEYLGEGLGNICVLLSPDVLILTGGLSRAKDYFLPAMKRVFASWRMNTAFEHMKIKVSRSPNLGSIGAAMYAQHHFGRKK